MRSSKCTPRDRDVTLLEVPRAGQVIERRGRRWLIVRMAGADDAAEGILHDVQVDLLEERGQPGRSSSGSS